jgi:hypothetical protein
VLVALPSITSSADQGVQDEREAVAHRNALLADTARGVYVPPEAGQIPPVRAMEAHAVASVVPTEDDVLALHQAAPANFAVARGRLDHLAPPKYPR